jgi:hypothetical protein
MKTGINTGILTNAYPLSTEQIKELEKLALEEQKAFAYLDENSQLCFALPGGVDGIKDLAWNNVYELQSEEGTFTKKVYIKTGLDTYTHTATLTKLSIDDAWQGDNSSDQPVIMKAAGLYETGTDTMTASWEDLITDGIMVVNNGEVGVGTKLPDELPEKNEHGFYFGVPYYDSYGWGYAFYEDGSFAECEQGYEPYYYPAGSATYSNNKIYISEWDCSLDVTNNGCAIADMAEGGYSFGLGEKHSVAGDLVLPNDNSIVIIPTNAFMAQDLLTNIIIPDSVTSIGVGAFYNCDSLISVVIGDSVTSIREGAFASCESLTSITIPDGVTSIGNHAFEGCTSLTSIEIPNSVTSIGKSAFCECSSLTEITLPFVGNAKEGASDTHFGYIFGANSYNDHINYIPTSLRTVNITAATSIEPYAFYDCSNLMSITIPSSVTYIGDSAFEGCYKLIEVVNKSRSITVVQQNDANGYIGYYAMDVYNANDTFTGTRISNNNGYIIYNSRYDGKYLMGYYGEETNLVIPSYVDKINDYAFYDCSDLTEVVIPDGVIQIGEYAFKRCEFTSITIPDSVIWIGRHAFEGCWNLQNITIGQNVSYIYDHAFAACTNLTSITIPDSVGPYINNGLFKNCGRLESIVIPTSITKVQPDAFLYCSNLKDVYYKGTEEQWNSIDINYTNYYLKNATIHYNYQPETPDQPVVMRAAGLYETGTDTMTASWDELLADGTVHVDNGVVYTNPVYLNDSYYAEHNDSSDALTGDLVLPNNGSITSIGDAYYTDEGFTGRHGFFLCKNLTSITIPDSVQTISADAFARCCGLTNITIPNSVTSIGSFAFEECSSLTSVTIPNSVTFTGHSTFSCCSSLTNVTIPNSVTSIGIEAFAGCSSLTEIVIPDSVTSIREGAFAGCSSLASVEIGGSVTSIEGYAFVECNILTDVYYNGTVSQWNSIDMGEGNECLTNATIHYKYQDNSDTNPV